MFDGGLIWGISWLWYLIGLLGVAGTIAFLVVAPATFGMVLQTIMRFLITTRPGWAIMALAIAIPLTDIHRSRTDEADFAARTAAFEQAQKDRDARIAKETRDQVTDELKQQTVENTKVDTDVDTFQKALPPVPATGNPFAVGPDACRLRVIAGLACNQDRTSRKGVPKVGTKAHAAGHKR